MAEGHLIHRWAALETAGLVGRPVRASSPQGSFAAGAAELDGRVLLRVEAHGKHLFHGFEGDRVLHVHFGLAGTLARVVSGAPPRQQCRLRLAGATESFDLYAPRTCALIDPAELAARRAALGPDPLRGDADPERVWRGLRERSESIGAALLDQSLVAGVGNVLRAEVLHALGIHPATPARSLDRPTFEALWALLAVTMREARDLGRIVTRVPPGETAAVVPEAQARWIYKQARCRRCGDAVETSRIGGRTAYACATCQPASGLGPGRLRARSA